MLLTIEEYEQCKQTFMHVYDKDSSGVIDSVELKAALESLGLSPTDAELQLMMSQLDTDKSGGIDFDEFVRIIERQKAAAAARDGEADTLEAFVALGGKSDRSGAVSVEKLRRTVMDFELTINIDAMLQEMDKDANGSVDYNEFKLLLSSAI